MKTILDFFLNLIFIFSVAFIWLMLIYQFILSLAGFWGRQRQRRQGGSAANLADDRLPAVSLIIPARNEERVIGQTLKRMRELDYPRDKLEIIVVNDNSNDRTREIVRRLASQDSRIRLLEMPADQSGRGKSQVLNLGWRQAAHDIVAVYDADNIPEKDALKKLCQALVADPRLAAVTGKFRAYNRGRNLLTRLINIESVAFQWIIQAGRWQLLKIAMLPGTNFVIRKPVLQAIGGWDNKALTEDSELTFRIYERGYLIRFLPSSVSWEQEPEKWREWFRQRIRWARGNNYIVAKNRPKPGRARRPRPARELLNLFYLYYFFIFAILFSDLTFILALLKLVHIRLIGPFAELWALAFLLFLLEIMIALAYEREDTVTNLLAAVLAYLTYTKLWVVVVLRALYLDVWRRSPRVWLKTERFPLPTEKKPRRRKK